VRSPTHPRLAYAALAAVCIFWGTTYLGIRIALESMSPAMLMFLRYALSSILMMVAVWATGATFPRGSELWRTAFYGVLTIGIGTGSLAVSELWLPSSMAAMIVTTQPFWMVGTEAWLGGERLQWRAIRGMLIGLAGVIVLFWPAVFEGGSNGLRRADLLAGFAMLQFGAMAWSYASIRQRNMRSGVHPFVSGAVQQLATAMVFAIPALAGPQPDQWTLRGLSAIVYLAVFGGVIGYSAYIYSMYHLPVALVSIYTYINPIVAVLLGWLFYRELFGWREAIAMLVIFAGVAVVKRASVPLRRAAAAE